MKVTNTKVKNNNIWQLLDDNNWNVERQDEIYITTGITWEKYQELTQKLAEQSHYRISYSNQTLQIMSPGRNHEKIKEYLSSLLEIYFQEAEIDYYPLGSTTFKAKNQKVAKEPDSCYCIDTEKEFPDLAIEVIFSSGGLDVLEIYQTLQVKEVWLWQNNNLKIYYLENNFYIEQKNSKLLPKLDVELFKQYLSQPNLRIAIKNFRKEL